MTLQIKDGAGQGKLAKVDANQRLHVQATTETGALNANKNGEAFNINTKDITLTSAASTPILYLKNTDDKDLHIITIVVGAEDSTGGDSSEKMRLTYLKNPTAGTTVDNANVVGIPASNRNYGSTDTGNLTAYKGATGETITDGSEHIYVYANTGSRTAIGIDEILPKGKSMALKLQPQTGNTSVTVYAAVICHYDDAENKD